MVQQYLQQQQLLMFVWCYLCTYMVYVFVSLSMWISFHGCSDEIVELHDVKCI